MTERKGSRHGVIIMMAMNVEDFLFAPAKPNPVAFGSGTERRLFPVHTTPTRFGIEQGLRGEPHRGPGCYEPDPVSGR